MWGELSSEISAGNQYVMIILALAFIQIMIIVQRLLVLVGYFNVKIPKFIKDIRKMVEAEDIDRARNYCKTVSSDSIPKITLAALQAYSTDPQTVKGNIEEATIEFLPRIEKGISVLPAISTLILLIGVLGTIDGLWGAFHSIDVLDTAKKQASLANGIAGSLTPTALGLLTAMLGLAAHHFVKGIAINLIDRIQYGVTALHNILVPQEIPAPVYHAPLQMAPVQEPVHEQHNNIDTSSQNEGLASHEDTFDSATIDDIKDEEEII